VSALRQLQSGTAETEVHLFVPQTAVRERWDVNQDTPLPIETPAGQNPLDGAIVDYYLKLPPAGDLKLTIYDSHNNVVREYSSVASVVDSDPANVPSYWFAELPQLPKAAGLNRFAWDLRYAAPKALSYSYYGNRLDYIEYTLPDHAIPGETPRQQPMGALVAPGKYSVVLNAAEKNYRQEVTVAPDPRVPATQQDLELQVDAEKSISSQMAVTYDGYNQLLAFFSALGERHKALSGNPEAKDAVDGLNTLGGKVALVANGGRTGLGLGPINRELARLMAMIESGDARPAQPLREAIDQYCGELQKRLAEWRDNSQSIGQVNTLLAKYSLDPLPLATVTISGDPPCGNTSVARPATTQSPAGNVLDPDKDDDNDLR